MAMSQQQIQTAKIRISGLLKCVTNLRRDIDPTSGNTENGLHDDGNIFKHFKDVTNFEIAMEELIDYLSTYGLGNE